MSRVRGDPQLRGHSFLPVVSGVIMASTDTPRGNLKEGEYYEKVSILFWELNVLVTVKCWFCSTRCPPLGLSDWVDLCSAWKLSVNR